MNPYLFGGIFVDYIIRGRYHLIPKHPEVVDSTDLAALLLPAAAAPAEQAAATEQTAMGTDTGRKDRTSANE